MSSNQSIKLQATAEERVADTVAEPDRRQVRAKRDSALAVLVAVLLVIAAGSLGTASAAFLGKNGKIAVWTNRDGNLEIYVMDPDGSNPTNLTNHPADDCCAAWSPDGTKIAFSSNRDGNSEIWVMHADGSNPTRLTNNTPTEVNSAPVWSPDGTKIAFQRAAAPGFPSVRQVWVMDADGTNQTNLSNTNTTADENPTWSPDGTKIAFSRNNPPGPGTVGDIWVMDANGANQTQITFNFPFDTGQPDWSPDGAKIAFLRFSPDFNYEVYVMNADGTNQVRLTNTPTGEGVPRWSPDGTKIAFNTARDGNIEVYVMDADGSNQTNLTNNAALDAVGSWQAISIAAPDSDGDGIFDEVDEQPLVASRRFSDVARGGSTAGSFFGGTPGTVQVVDHPDPAKGVRVVVTTGAVDPFFFSLDGKGSVLVLGPGTYTLTDPDAITTIEVEQGGPAEVELVVAGQTTIIEIEEGEIAEITETFSGETLVGVAVTALEGTITVNGMEVSQGSSLTVGALSSIRLTITRVPRRPTLRAFALTATFVPGTGSDGVSPLTEAVKIRVGTYVETIPAGSFRRDARGRFWFTGKIDGVLLAAVITPLQAGRFRVDIAGTGAILVETVNPVPVGVVIGDDGATAETVVRNLP